jgi:hypothetical protein
MGALPLRHSENKKAFVQILYGGKGPTQRNAEQWWTIDWRSAYVLIV